MSSQSHPSLPVVMGTVAVAVIAVSTAAIFVRFAQREAPSLVIAAIRLTLASLALAPLALGRYKSALRGLSRRDLTLALLAGVFLAAHFGTWISSLEYTSVASSLVFVSTSPLWVSLFSPLFLREPLRRSAVIGMLLALTGGILIGAGDLCRWDGGVVCQPLVEFISGRAFLGNALALSGALTVAGYFMIGRSLRARLPLVPYIFLVYGMAAVVLLTVCFASGFSFLGFSPSTYLWMVLLAVIPQLFGHSIYNWALRYLPAAFVSIATLSEPVGSSLLAFVILGETPTLMLLIGGAFILAGIYAASQQP